jgi:hypothetical protein
MNEFARLFLGLLVVWAALYYGGELLGWLIP